jgi:hypothetical protein
VNFTPQFRKSGRLGAGLRWCRWSGLGLLPSGPLALSRNKDGEGRWRAMGCWPVWEGEGEPPFVPRGVSDGWEAGGSMKVWLKGEEDGPACSEGGGGR